MTFDKLFLTTTLPYANSVPHVGHALEFVQADALARRFRDKLGADNVKFNLGLDEHGSKIQEAARVLSLKQQKLITPQQLVDNLSVDWKKFCEDFQISYDSFYRTSSPEHHAKVKDLWNKCLAKGDLFKKSYTAKYCSGCESFKTEKDLVNGKCNDHPNIEIAEVSEENYFFKLSNYREEILEWISKTDPIKPHSRIPELLNNIKELDEISVSRQRSNLFWGVEVPNDPDQTIYVWFDALFNYLIAAGDWNNAHIIQLCGPDNVKFQAYLWQAFLRSVGGKFTDQILVHGTVTDSDGRKISKSLGNGVDPQEQFEKYGADPVRYYILGGLSTFGNSSWREEDLITSWNDLANNWGNLVNRVLHLSERIGISEEKHPVEIEIKRRFEIAEKHWDSFEIRLGIQEALQCSSELNKVINDEQPWKSGDSILIGSSYRCLSLINKILQPAIPAVSSKVENAILSKRKAILFNKIKP